MSKSHKQLQQMLDDALLQIERQERGLKAYRTCDEKHEKMLKDYPAIKEAWDQYVTVKRLMYNDEK